MRGLVLSILVHAGIIAAGLIYLPRAAREVMDSPIVPIELVTLADTTNIRPAAPEPEPEEPEETIEDEIVDPVAPEPEPEPEAAEPEPEPEPIQPEPEPEPEEAEPEPDPEPDPEPEPQEPEPDPEPEEPAEPSLNDLLGDLERQVDRSRDRNAEDTGRREGSGDNQQMTATLQDIIRSHLARCWRASLDAPNPDELAVELTIYLNRDGTLRQPPSLQDQSRVLNSGNPYLRVAGERALRAASQCAPYPLPSEAYSEWRQITVTFSPSLYSR